MTFLSDDLDTGVRKLNENAKLDTMTVLPGKSSEAAQSFCNGYLLHGECMNISLRTTREWSIEQYYSNSQKNKGIICQLITTNLLANNNIQTVSDFNGPEGSWPCESVCVLDTDKFCSSSILHEQSLDIASCRRSHSRV